MPERVGWWAVGSAALGTIFVLSLFGFTFLSDKISANDSVYRAEIKDVRLESATSIKDFRSEIIARFDSLDRKIESLRK